MSGYNISAYAEMVQFFDDTISDFKATSKEQPTRVSRKRKIGIDQL